MTKVAIGGFQHETNTFVDASTTYATFEAADGWPGLTRGVAVFDALHGRNIGMAGLIDGAKRAGWDVAPLAWCGGGAGGVVADDAFERISALLLADLAAALPLDGVLLDLHGAMATETFADADAEFLRRVRALVGDAVPVVCSLDLHANISPEMTDLADMLVVYRTYPHLDMAETGRRAAQHLGAIIQRGERPYAAFRQIPFLIPTTSGCTLKDPAKSVYASAARLERQPGVSELGFACGFSPSDVPNCGPSVVGYGEDASAVEAAVDELATFALAQEDAFAEQYMSIDTAIDRAVATTSIGSRPVILADVDDNAGAGESSASTFLLEALIRKGAANALVGLLFDPAAVAAATNAGVGAAIDIALGGAPGDFGSPAFRHRFTVESLSDGRFRAGGAYFGDVDVDLGSMALLRANGTRVLVSSQREQAADPAMFSHIGADPREVDILVLKSSVHFRADFSAMAAEIINVAAPNRPRDPKRLFDYRRLRAGVRMAPRGDASL